MVRKSKCPKCGKRSIDIRYYKDGDRFYVHTGKVIGVPGMFAFNEITGCMVKAPAKTPGVARPRD